MFTEKEIKDARDKAYKEAGHNAYFGNGFEAGIKFAIESNRLEKLVRQGVPQPVQTAGSLEQKIKEFADIYGLECPNNDGNCGTIAEHGCDGTPEDCERTCPVPVQCEFCYTEPRSKFNLINDLKEMIGGLSA
jgi:hypothetical protein